MPHDLERGSGEPAGNVEECQDQSLFHIVILTAHRASGCSLTKVHARCGHKAGHDWALGYGYSGLPPLVRRWGRNEL